MIATVSPSVDVPRRLDHARKMIFINYKLIMHDANARAASANTGPFDLVPLIRG